MSIFTHAPIDWTADTVIDADCLNQEIHEKMDDIDSIITDWANWTPIITYSGGTTNPTSNIVDFARFCIIRNVVHFYLKSTLVRGTGNRTATFFSLPVTRLNSNLISFAGTTNITGSNIYGSPYSDGVSVLTFFHTMASNGFYAASGFYEI